MNTNIHREEHDMIRKAGGIFGVFGIILSLAVLEFARQQVVHPERGPVLASIPIIAVGITIFILSVVVMWVWLRNLVH